MKNTQAEAVMALCKKERLDATLSKDGVVALTNTRTKSLEFKHKNADSIVGFIWNKVKNKQVTIFESQAHKIVVSAFIVDGFAAFSLELHVKSEPNVYKVENLVSPTNNKQIQRTEQARLPYSVASILNLDWFKELRSMLRNFNERYHHAL